MDKMPHIFFECTFLFKGIYANYAMFGLDGINSVLHSNECCKHFVQFKNLVQCTWAWKTKVTSKMVYNLEGKENKMVLKDKKIGGLRL
jgi:hypothetical protein